MQNLSCKNEFYLHKNKTSFSCSWTSPQWPSWGQKKVAVVERFINKSQCMDCPPKNVATVEWWLLWRARGGGGNARRKFWIKPLKETDLSVAQDFFRSLKEAMLKHRQMRLYERSKWNELKIYISNIYCYIFSCATLNETFTAKWWWRFAQNTLNETKIQNLHP